MTTNAAPPLLEVQDLKKHFDIRGGFLRRSAGKVYAVDGLSFTIGHGETLGLVGESGCGKSTAGRSILKLTDPTSGTVKLNGRAIEDLSVRQMRPIRQHMQAVFQDPYSSLNPRLTAFEIVAEPLRNFEPKSQIRERISELFQKVGLRPDHMDRYPHEFSGGQRQRLGIARAISVRPALIVCDEAVSALDVSVQAQILNLLADIQADTGVSYLFIAHDLAVVEHISHRVGVMYLGKLVELAPKRQLFSTPRHPYTAALMSAVPIPDPNLARRETRLDGDVPSPINPPAGCRFHTRCPYAVQLCRTEAPAMREVADGHHVACHLSDSLSLAGAGVHA